MATKKKQKGHKPTPKNVANGRAKPRTGRLPGMEDAGIPELEKLAESLSDTRTERIRLSKEEGELQDDLLAMMKKYRKVEYHHEDVHAWREISEEKVKVRIGELKPAQAKKVAKAVEEVKAHSEEPKPNKQTSFEPSELGQEQTEAAGA